MKEDSNQELPLSIGSFKIIKKIGQGGMGEVFLAYDTSCDRLVALKRIRRDLQNSEILYNRFLREARITSQLAHPTIIPIYSIHHEDGIVYYTMPYVEGRTLKEILQITRYQEEEGLPSDHIGGSIPALVRIFLNVCQAIAFAHSKGVLHRDLKPGNVIVGKYGEIVILDWGLAKIVDTEMHEIDLPWENIHNPRAIELEEITLPGKFAGTLSFLAPERAKGLPASIQTDIYALGVMLYQILTLHTPFKRRSLKNFKKHMELEQLVDPAEIAPYRDVPPLLTRFVKKCLSKDPHKRHQSVDELVHEIENYLEGRSEWFQAAKLNIRLKTDWEFQENVLLTHNIAMGSESSSTDWVSLMVSRESFTGNLLLEANVRIDARGKGIGFLLSIPEGARRTHLDEGYCLWLSSDPEQGTLLYRSSVEVMEVPNVFLKPQEWHQISIRKVDKTLHFYLNDTFQFSYVSHIPLIGTHVGLMSKDADFDIKDFIISVGSYHLTVSCLAIPDAFLAHQDFDKAIDEYRRIAYSFPGRQEGREAQFRQGIAYMEKARNYPSAVEAKKLYQQAFSEFEKLKNTPAAPLEHLGKSLVYNALEESDDEINSLELGLRKYRQHPLAAVLEEQILFQMHARTRTHRKAAYRFILIALQLMPKITQQRHFLTLTDSIQKQGESLYFLDRSYCMLDTSNPNNRLIKNWNLSIELGFWLARPYTLREIFDAVMAHEPVDRKTIYNVLFALLELGAYQEAEICARRAQEGGIHHPIFQIALRAHLCPISQSFQDFLDSTGLYLDDLEERIFFYLLKNSLTSRKSVLILETIQKASQKKGSSYFQDVLTYGMIWIKLWDKAWIEAGELFVRFSEETLHDPNSPLYFLYYCWLMVQESAEIANAFASGRMEGAFPPIWTLGINAHIGEIAPEDRWFDQAFLWEKRMLYMQLALLASTLGDNQKEDYYRNLELKEYCPDEI